MDAGRYGRQTPYVEVLLQRITEIGAKRARRIEGAWGVAWGAAWEALIPVSTVGPGDAAWRAGLRARPENTPGRYACAAAAGALAARHILDPADYDTLTYCLRTASVTVHPDDPPLPPGYWPGGHR